MAQTTSPTSPTSPEVQPPPAQESSFILARDGDAIAHIVCCREASWEIAFCGEPNEAIAMDATAVCTMCIEVAKGRHPAWDMSAAVPTCPNDGEPCPDEHEIDLRILREVTS